MPAPDRSHPMDSMQLAHVAQLCASPNIDGDGLRQAAEVRGLLRQRAAEIGLLGETSEFAAQDLAIEALLEREVKIAPVPERACRRYYAAHRDRFFAPAAISARHILFQILPGAPLAAIRERAAALLAQLRQDPARFAACAKTHSNCPSGADGGALGMLYREQCVAELRDELFAGSNLGVLPRLLRSRYGFHIFLVERRETAAALPFEIVRAQIETLLHERALQAALARYVFQLSDVRPS